MSAPRSAIVAIPGWMFPAAVLAPLRAMAGGDGAWTVLPWEVALDPVGLRAAVAAQGSGCRIVAWSLGAIAALRLATEAPTALRGLVLLGATARLTGHAATGYAGVERAVLTAMRTRLRCDPHGLFREFFTRCRRPLAPAPEDAATFADAAVRTPPALAEAGLAMLAEADLRGVLDRIAVPVSVLHGGADAVVPVGQARALARALPRGSVRTLPRHGHLPAGGLLRAAAAALARTAAGADATGGGHVR